MDQNDPKSLPDGAASAGGQARAANLTQARRIAIALTDGDDTFMRTGRQVIEGCRLDIDVRFWMEEVRGMAEFIREWCINRRSQIRAVYLWPQGAKIVVFIVPVSESFNFDLADDLAELSLELVRQFHFVGPVDLLQIPEREVCRFVPPSGIQRPLLSHDRRTSAPIAGSPSLDTCQT